MNIRENKKVKSLVSAFRKRQHYFRESENIMRGLWYAREGGKASLALLGISTFGSIMNMVFPNEMWTTELKRNGFDRMNFSKQNADWMGSILEDSSLGENYQINDVEDISSGKLFKGEEEEVLYIKMKSKWQKDLLFGKGDNAKELLNRIIYNEVWGDNKEIELTVEGSITTSYKYSFLKMEEPGIYLGKKDPEYIAKRLKRYDSLKRTILFRGPSGVGKGVLARQVAKHIDSGSKVLKISNNALKFMVAQELVEMMNVLKPTILLLDDMNLSQNISSNLALFESLSAQGCLIIVTEMTNFKCTSSTLNRGDFYHPGMRPGRIDEVYNVALPDREEREMIMRHYLSERGEESLFGDKNVLNEILDKTDNLSGAYLKSFIERVCVHGHESWRFELEQILYSAPKFDEDEDEVPPKEKEVAFDESLDKAEDPVLEAFKSGSDCEAPTETSLNS